ncbi:HSF-type DNA-binding-domain-containing protein [Radiomyces spectabilis]|uniref:HSF-type DNA-binding-domain-containing protein n=1 Tax=Radiomyces spectabilis TaxID=64574 RepID=UPI00221FFFB6|nr:HSF-type DNA-binding-domain-containing protein [Radiomyces spectabilis]KAI8367675.1 HSF-type DNA-binding-domain-containing protein [Radiomyces spectabilis]
MNHRKTSSQSSIGISPQAMFNNSSVSSGSPLSSPLASPISSPYMTPGDSSSWDQLQNQFSQQMSLQPPSTQPVTKSNANNTFVHKLYNMVVDKQYQHLIAWTYTGTSFIVCNITDFSRDVLPKHFKHNNFSSFVRQLNMYGFHKVNKSPRGHRTLAENQIWEFSHPKFLRGRADLLDEIKRKALDNDVVRRDTGDMNSHMTMMQVAHSEMMQQLGQLQENFSQVMKELSETRRRQAQQQYMLKSMMDFLAQQYGAPLQLPSDYTFEAYDSKVDSERPPSIYVTSPDVHTQQQQLQTLYMSMEGQPTRPSPSPTSHSSGSTATHPNRPPPLTVQTQNIHPSSPLNMNIPFHSMDTNHQPVSPSSLSAYQSAVNTPLPPSPNPNAFLSDDEAASMYSPHSPHTPNNYIQSSEPNVQQAHQRFAIPTAVSHHTNDSMSYAMGVTEPADCI